MNIGKVSESMMCSNCGACAAVCPHGAVRFDRTSMGRLYAAATDDCTDCGLCLKACPSVCSMKLAESLSDRYAGVAEDVCIGRAADPVIYANAQSGGACTAIVSWLFDQGLIDGALVCGMSFGQLPQVSARIVSSRQELLECQKSCYTPVDLLSALKLAEDRKSLAVVGLPCHIEGTVTLAGLQKRFTNIKYRIGLVCDLTMCGGVQDVFRKLLPEGNLKVEWRSKANGGYRQAPVRLFTEDGQERIVPAKYRLALKGMYTSPRCRVCSDKMNVHSDITLGDPWGLEGVDWNGGDSLIIARTSLGRSVVDGCISSGALAVSSHPEYSVVLAAQHIDDRRMSVTCASALMKKMFPASDIPLLQQMDSELPDRRYCEKMDRRISDFVKCETMREEEVVRLAEKTIELALRKDADNGHPLRRLFHELTGRLGK